MPLYLGKCLPPMPEVCCHRCTAMPYHTVAQGECFVSLAHTYGFGDACILYDHPNNADLKRRRPNPNVLLPGDQVYVPERAAIQCVTGRIHRFKLRRPQAKLRVHLKDHDGNAHAGKRYRIEAGSAVLEGTTDNSGLCEAEVPPDATEACLSLWLRDEETPTRVWKLDIGHLDPVDSMSGAQARLRNLGLYHGAVDGSLGRATKVALADFQRVRGLTVTGKLDEATRSALTDSHSGT
jgi:hypothetical protein